MHSSSPELCIDHNNRLCLVFAKYRSPEMKCLARDWSQYYQRQNDSAESVDLSDVQIVQGRVTPEIDFEATLLFDVRYLKNGTRYSYTYNDRLVGSCIRSVDGAIFNYFE